jgi:methionyl aminopeptidase
VAVTIKTTEEIALLREGGKRLAAIRDTLAREVKAGVSALDIERIARKLFAASGGEPSFLHYKSRKGENSFPASTCISVNDAVVHGLPKGETVFAEGDVVGIDVGLNYKGLFTDTAVTVGVGKISREMHTLLSVTSQALDVGIKAVANGVHIGDIGFAIESFVKAHGQYGIVRELAGHGVGYKVHEEPHIPNYGKPKTGETLHSGMVIAIEPMLNAGAAAITLDRDGYTYRTKDGSRSAHFEHTVVVTDTGAEILTAL